MRTRLIRNPDSYFEFLRSLSTESPAHYKGFLDALHAQCVMQPLFLNFHRSRYKTNPPKTIAGSHRHGGDVRDSMQLILSQEVPFITSDHDLTTKLPTGTNCQVIYSELKLELIVTAMRLVNGGMLTADKCP